MQRSGCTFGLGLRVNKAVMQTHTVAVEISRGPPRRRAQRNDENLNPKPLPLNRVPDGDDLALVRRTNLPAVRAAL